MNDLVRFQEPHQLTAANIRASVNLVQEVMKAVMQGPSKENPQGVHYGTIPGTPKPTLYKPGAEKLAQAFRIAVSYRVEDLSTPDTVRYRVTAIGTHQTSGIIMGDGMGECSSGEEKYKWRKATSKAEFDATPEDRRRVKHGKEYSTNQVRTEPADLANTILKMGCKRAQVAMILNVTAASDCFTQDIEDLPEELRPGADAPEPKETGPKAYSAEQFEKNLPAWTNLIKTGTKTAEAIIKTVSCKAVLSEDQKKKILAVKVEPKTEGTLLDSVKRICAAAIATEDKETAFLRLDDARILLPEMSEAMNAAAVKEIDAALETIKGRE